MRYVCSKTRKVLFREDCVFVQNIKEENKVWFNTLDEGIEYGCKLCKHCMAKEEYRIEPEKILGKIIAAEYGSSRKHPHLFGLHIAFRLGDGNSVGCDNRYIIDCKKMYEELSSGENNEMMSGMTRLFLKIDELLTEARVKYISELINIPVEVTVEKNAFVDFRILTEVL